MSDPRYGDEPSMAEILASVRRIVAEEQTPSAGSRFERQLDQQVDNQATLAQDELKAENAHSLDPNPANASFSTPSNTDHTVDKLPATEPFRPETQDIPVASEGSKRSILGRLLERQAQSDAPVETKRPPEDPVESEPAEDDNVLDLVNPIQAPQSIDATETDTAKTLAPEEPAIGSQSTEFATGNQSELSDSEALDAAVARWVAGEGKDMIRSMVREEMVALLGAAIKDKT